MKSFLRKFTDRIGATRDRVRAAYARLPLSPAETAVALFVLCALTGSLIVRGWMALARSAPPGVPAEFAALDSQFLARSRAANVADVQDDGVMWSSTLTARKTPPLPHSIDLNTAGPDQLRRLPAVGPALAARIIAFRRATPFRRAEDIMRVEGIGPRKWARMQEFIKTP